MSVVSLSSENEAAVSVSVLHQRRSFQTRLSDPTGQNCKEFKISSCYSLVGIVKTCYTTACILYIYYFFIIIKRELLTTSFSAEISQQWPPSNVILFQCLHANQTY